MPGWFAVNTVNPIFKDMVENVFLLSSPFHATFPFNKRMIETIVRTTAKTMTIVIQGKNIHKAKQKGKAHKDRMMISIRKKSRLLMAFSFPLSMNEPYRIRESLNRNIGNIEQKRKPHPLL